MLPRLSTAVVACVALLQVLAPGAGAQGEGDLDVRMELVEQLPWHHSDSTLGITLELTNEGDVPLEGIGIQVALYARSVSRSQLQASYEGRQAFDLGLESIVDPEVTLDPGESHQVALTNPLSSLSSFAATTEGVYPLAITLADVGTDQVLDTVRTALVVYPEDPENPLHLALVVPLADVPSRGPGGSFRADLDGEFRLERATEPGGWLSGLVSALRDRAEEGMHVAVAPSPRLVEELADQADGYRRVTDDGETEEIAADSPTARAAGDVLDDLEVLLGQEEVQPVLAPYANPDLPWLAELDWVAQHVNEGERAFEEALGSSPGRDWIFAAGGRLDGATLERLALADAGTFTFFGPDSLEPAVEGEPSTCVALVDVTPACPIAARSTGGEVHGYGADRLVQDRLLDVVREPSPLHVQRFLAETAMIHSELPGTQRVLHAALPSGEPAPELTQELLERIGEAPWLRSVTPAEGLDLGLDSIPRSIVSRASPAPSEPDASLQTDIDQASDRLATFQAIEPPVSLVERLIRNLLVAQSRSWWSDPELVETAQAYAVQTEGIADAELAKISVQAPPEITLTSEEGEITMSLVNEADYPVTVRIVPESDDVTFDPAFIEDTFEANGTSQFRVDVISRSSGIFPVQVHLQTPEGEDIRPLDIRVRSTTLNDIAVVITLGALAFLILFYATRGVRQRRRSGRTRVETTAT